MPILDVEIVLSSGESVPRGLAAAIADAAAAVFNTPPGETWVRLHELRRDCYSENGGGPDLGILPVFVRVLRATIPSQPELEKEASALAARIAQACNRRPENVHLVYDPPGTGRIAFGGRLLKSDDGA